MIAIVIVFAGLMLLARLIGLAVVALLIARLIVTRLVVTWHERLRLRRNEAGLLAEIRKVLAFVIAVLRGHFILGARLRLVLAELFLGRGDQAEIVLCVLVVVLRSHRIAGRPGVARQLHVFLSDVRGGAANLDVGSVGLEHPGHRVLAAPVIVIIVVVIATTTIVVVPVTHPLVVVLTVSHVSPLFQP